MKRSKIDEMAQVVYEALYYSGKWSQVDGLTRGELVERTGLRDRDVRAAVEYLVAEGVPVISVRTSPGGYRITRSSRDIRQEIQRLRKHARHINSRARSLAGHLKRVA